MHETRSYARVTSEKINIYTTLDIKTVCCVALFKKLT